MPYSRYFGLTDPVVSHVNGMVMTVPDPLIRSRYIALIAVGAVTVYELCVKDIFRRFGARKHKVLEVFVSSYFDRINGRIKLKNIQDDYLPRFGDLYLKRFKSRLAKREQQSLRDAGESVVASYNNIIEWRHQFVHEGSIPSHVTCAEVVDSYELGKIVIDVLAKTMTR